MTKTSVVSREHSAPLVQLLEESFRAGDDVDAACGAAIPSEWWNRALLDPLREFLGRPSKAFRARLVHFGFQLGGASGGHPPPELPLLIESLHAGSLIIDDIEDGSDRRRGAAALHRSHGMPVALNAANWLYFWAQVRLSQLPLTDATRLIAHERLAACLMRCHEGQALDLTVRVADAPQTQVGQIVDAITTLKTGSLLGLAASLGALAAGARGARLEAIGAFGRAAGVGLQMLDDLSGFVNCARREKAREDLRHQRATWVWAWLADDLSPAAYERLRMALSEIDSDAAIAALSEDIGGQVDGIGQRRARAQLENAIAQLRAVIGGGSWCEEIGAEIARLEAGYGTI